MNRLPSGRKAIAAIPKDQCIRRNNKGKSRTNPGSSPDRMDKAIGSDAMIPSPILKTISQYAQTLPLKVYQQKVYVRRKRPALAKITLPVAVSSTKGPRIGTHK